MKVAPNEVVQELKVPHHLGSSVGRSQVVQDAIKVLIYSILKLLFLGLQLERLKNLELHNFAVILLFA